MSSKKAPAQKGKKGDDKSAPKEPKQKAAAAPKAQAPVVAAPSVDQISAKQVKGGDNVSAKLALVMKSGKVSLGYKSTLKQLRNGKAKAILVSSNCPPLRRSEIEYFAMLTKTTLHHFAGNNKNLGIACGKFFPVSVMSVTEGGDSDLLTYLETNN